MEDLSSAAQYSAQAEAHWAPTLPTNVLLTKHAEGRYADGRNEQFNDTSPQVRAWSMFIAAVV
jgi:hypothetical protein